MATDNFVQPAIPRFDGHYDHWSMLMENFLRSKEYWQVVSDGVKEPAAGTILTDAQRMELEGQRLKDLKAKNYLFQAIDRSILETILCKDTSKHIWDSMKKKYQGSARARRQQLQTLRTEFETLRMKLGESVTDFFSRTMAIVNKMRIHGDNMEDVTIVEKILRSMTPKFNFVVCSIEEANDIEELSIDELQNLKTNLLSVGQLQEKGYEISIKDGVCRIQDAKLGLIAQVNMTISHFDVDEDKQQPAPTTQNVPLAETEEIAQQRPLRQRRRPTWMMDYEVMDSDDSEEDPLTHFALFSNCDPVAFKDASEDQIADIMTKPLKLAPFLKLRKLLGVSTLEVLCVSGLTLPVFMLVTVESNAINRVGDMKRVCQRVEASKL
ncbi:hypothetical protein FEM48_Zijuj06G0139300 [Ziziphus jujuba var. spinosa]|uniref:Retrovirus-related Pol polyprotein from transposon TNT 1-94 n=1 Tax=Ziziphus jujuba var. spinosa TaxID=714518 RepID=A0A978V9P2_ZIZJJ|nr:hypothetical protein FEM48_Zijuj06G0139300 [Ziziphus jujuba var. spinosa]